MLKCSTLAFLAASIIILGPYCWPGSSSKNERFWTLFALVGCFLDEQQAELSQQQLGSHYSQGAGCYHLQAKNCINLLKGLEQQFRKGPPVEQVAFDLVAGSDYETANILIQVRMPEIQAKFSIELTNTASYRRK